MTGTTGRSSHGGIVVVVGIVAAEPGENEWCDPSAWRITYMVAWLWL